MKKKKPVSTSSGGGTYSGSEPITWKIRGKIMLKHSNSTIRNTFPDIVPLKGIKVKVSAREKVVVWGPFNSWDEVTTGSDGLFEVKKEKDKSHRQFKIEVLFKDDSLKIYPDNDGLLNKITEGLTDLAGDVLATMTRCNAVDDIVDSTEDAIGQVFEQTSRIAYDVKWFKILDEEKNDTDHSHGTIDFGQFVFGNSTQEDLNDSIAIKHAIVWFVYKEVFSYINNLGSSVHFDNKKPVALKYPHDNPIINDNLEESYASPYNYVIFVIKNKKKDRFSVDTILHELMHIWAYQHCSKEKGMAWQLAINGGTHNGLQTKSFVAFHEGFAEWASNYLTKKIFGVDSTIYGGETDNGLPFSRFFLKKKKIKDENDIDKSEYGWISLFNILLFTSNLQLYDFNANDVHAELSFVTWPAEHVCSSPELSFEEILKIFVVHKSKGYEKVLKKREMNLVYFLQRTADIYGRVTSDHVSAIKNLLNPSKTDNAVDVICLPSSKSKKKDNNWKTHKDSKGPPDVPREDIRARTNQPKANAGNANKMKPKAKRRKK